ncbi:MAG TPA: glycosyl hydrolase 115 family protein [Candidatus Sulfopaludibacter sp.]|nr:glycosyl hydrolase 115 family protein [Candidatus Sulfopaludibacter sp.]
MQRAPSFAAIVGLLTLSAIAYAQSTPFVALDFPASSMDFAIVAGGKAAPIYVAPGNSETVKVAAQAFASDVERVTGVKPEVLASLPSPLPASLILVGVYGQSPEIDRLQATRKIVGQSVAGNWESATTSVVLSPMSGVRRALVVAGSDRRGAAYALFTLSRQMGVSPWTWWADVPVAHRAAVYVSAGVHVQHEPSVRYRGIFLNDEDWGLRPWAAKKMDPTVDNGKGNIGPRTYERIFELLLRLHANSLWPAMHPGSLAFNAVPENAKLADKWGIVMGSSHSEALLRNNVGEWNEAAPPKGDGPWNYQANSAAMNAYWDKRLQENGKYENFYTVGLRGVHDSGLEAKGTPEVKAKLVEDVMTEQRKLLAERVNPDVTKVPQILWLYKESLDLYRVGMKVPDDVTLGWTDDNYGYIRELPNAAEQKRAGGSGVYYHVSYWGAPHDYLWLCTTPPALIREEMTKAYDHNARRYWILNVGDLKPAEIDIDYFMQLAFDEPGMAAMSQRDFLTRWFAQQFPGADAKPIVDVMTRYYALNFVRKPEFMGFNGYNDGIERTAFNPLAWGDEFVTRDAASNAGGVDAGHTFRQIYNDQNHARAGAWDHVRADEMAIAKTLPPQYGSAFFELVEYPVEGSAAMNEKFLSTDRTFLDAVQHNEPAMEQDATRAHTAYDTIQTLTAKYNALEDGKWDGMMSAHPRDRHVFEMPRTAADADTPLPASWGVGSDACQSPAGPAGSSGFAEQHCTVSINAAHFARSHNGNLVAQWRVLADLGISGSSIVFGEPGRPFGQIMTVASVQGLLPIKGGIFPWLEYDFTTTTAGPATLALHLLPTFPLDSDHKLRYAVALDGGAPMERDMSGSGTAKAAGAGDGPSGADWPQNVLRNSAIDTIPLGKLAPGKHTLRLLYRDPGVVFEHLAITLPGAPPAYPVPPETK